MAGSTYGTAEQQQQQQQQQAVQSNWLESSGFYVGGDRRPQQPPQPSGLGFYTRDSQTLEAQLVAQAYQNHQGGAASAAMNTAGLNTAMMDTNTGGMSARDSLQAYLNARAAEQPSEPAQPPPGGAGWLAAGLGAGLTGAGGYGHQPGLQMQNYGFGAQPQAPWNAPAPTGGLFGTPNGALGLGQGAGSIQNFPQQRAADQTGGGLMLRSTSAQHLCLSGNLPGIDQQQQFNNHQDQQQQQQQIQQGLPLMQQPFQMNQDQYQPPQQQQQQLRQSQSLASLTNAELQQRLAMMSGGGNLGQEWATGGPSVTAGMFGVGVTASIGPQIGPSLDLQALPGSTLKQARSPDAVTSCVYPLRVNPLPCRTRFEAVSGGSGRLVVHRMLYMSRKHRVSEASLDCGMCFGAGGRSAGCVGGAGSSLPGRCCTKWQCRVELAGCL